MGRALIGQRDRPPRIHFTVGFAFHQHGDAVRQLADLTFLARDNIGEVINGAGQVGKLFFKVCSIIHTAHYGAQWRFANPYCCAVVRCAVKRE